LYFVWWWWFWSWVGGGVSVFGVVFVELFGGVGCWVGYWCWICVSGVVWFGVDFVDFVGLCVFYGW